MWTESSRVRRACCGGQLVAHNRGPVAQGPALGAAGTHWLFRRLFQPGVGAARRGRRHEGGGGARVLRGRGASGSCCRRCCGRPWTPERAGGDHGPALAVTPLPAALPVRFCGKISVGRAARVYTGLFGASLRAVELCVRFGVSPRGSGCVDAASAAAGLWAVLPVRGAAAFDADGRPAEDAQGTSRLRRRKDRAERLLRRRARGTEVADGPSRSCESWRPGRGGHGWVRSTEFAERRDVTVPSAGGVTSWRGGGGWEGTAVPLSPQAVGRRYNVSSRAAGHARLRGPVDSTAVFKKGKKSSAEREAA